MKNPVSICAAKTALLALLLILVAGCRSSGAGNGDGASPRSSSDRTTPGGTVSEQDIEHAQSMDLPTIIAARIPGVRVIYAHGEMRVLIRGESTFSGSPYALVVVDGLVGSLSAVNPRDIASIKVLKGASATMFGVRGANGVLTITTKRGPRREE